MESREEITSWDWTIGVIVAPFGIRGEMKTELRTDEPDRYSILERVALVMPDGRFTVRAVESARLHKGRILLKLEGIDSIESVEEWRGAEVRIPRSEALPLPEDTYYVSDLIGLRVVTCAGVEVGKVRDVLRSPAHDLLCVGDDLIPMVRQIVTRIDLDNKLVEINPPQGLLSVDVTASTAGEEAE